MSETVLVQKEMYSGDLPVKEVFGFLNIVDFYGGINKDNKDLIRNNLIIDVESCREYVADLFKCNFLEKTDSGYVLTSQASEVLKSYNDNNPSSWLM
ncbi:MAG: hypothetical protein ABIG84_07955 [archaeon]